ncbi:unnamed protein product [Ranitomeya imitator]|uniref:POZ/BTB and AT hook containing zinc finger 1 n=1 Tax=Ranitomeya imitator TaxID=111125 RepID=A0ABN9MBB8_9NEOB|nr:unnamed protein product [Ranitomeya imitator]
MERLAEGCGPSCFTYQVRQHSADVLNQLNQQRKSGGRFCDVILRVGEDSFPAHRAVLAACSQYFESVLGDTEGPTPRELEMHTISSKVFGDILDFAYTARIIIRLESFPELMTAAKFLLMRSVIDICQEVIKQSNVQILVPPARPELMLFRSGASDLGFPLDMTNGTVMSGSGIAGSLGDDEEDSVRPGPAVPSQASLLALGASSQILPSPYQWGGLRETGVLPCGLCDKVFTDPMRLRQHEAQHGVTSLQLGYGDLQAPRIGENGLPQDESETPRKRNRARKQVACDLCGKIFRDVYHLNRHKLSHSGEKPYSCPVCGLRFKRKDRMSYHVRSHDGSVGKPYICQSCGKGFSRPDHLNGHIKQVHTSERPHKCESEGGATDPFKVLISPEPSTGENAECRLLVPSPATWEAMPELTLGATVPSGPDLPTPATGEHMECRLHVCIGLAHRRLFAMKFCKEFVALYAGFGSYTMGRTAKDRCLLLL